MEPGDILRELRKLAESQGVAVRERALGPAPVRVRSGLCKVQGEPLVVLDRKIPVQEKIAVLAEALNQIITEDMYVIPAIREILEAHKPADSSNPENAA
ncbi:MAG: hypothetical protein JRI97_01470 [Deltaproteobacteria bacterium]|nr:hypothetical protein [Deltaproteobacteria bacterium]